MKTNRLHLLPIIIMILSLISLEAYAAKPIGTSLDSKIEISLEEKQAEIQLEDELLPSRFIWDIPHESETTLFEQPQREHGTPNPIELFRPPSPNLFA